MVVTDIMVDMDITEGMGIMAGMVITEDMDIMGTAIMADIIMEVMDLISELVSKFKTPRVAIDLSLGINLYNIVVSLND